ncbi:MAG: glutathione synthase, partial [Aquabacterium sp.]
MKLLFVADPLDTFKTYKDSTFAMMREAAARGHELWACEPRELVWQRGSVVTATARRLQLTGDAHDWYNELEAAEVPL